MFNALARCGVVVAFGALLPLAAGCKIQATKRAALKMQVGARTITADLDGTGFITSDDKVATMHFSGRTLVIENERVLLDGKELAQLPAAATKVEVDYSAGTLTVTADGANMLTTDLRK